MIPVFISGLIIAAIGVGTTNLGRVIRKQIITDTLKASVTTKAKKKEPVLVKNFSPRRIAKE